MPTFNTAEHHSPRQKPGRKLSIFVASILLLLTAGIMGDYIGTYTLLGLASGVVNWVRLNVWTLRVTLILGFGGSLLIDSFRAKERSSPRSS